MDPMQILATVRNWLLPAALLIGLLIGAQYLRQLRFVDVRHEYRDLNAVANKSTVRVDPTVTLHRLHQHDLIAYTPGRGDNEVFGYVAALPGDTVAVAEERLWVNGEPFGDRRIGRQYGTIAPLVVPEGHVFTFSDSHQHDSLAYGPIPAAIIIGRYRGD